MASDPMRAGAGGISGCASCGWTVTQEAVDTAAGKALTCHTDWFGDGRLDHPVEDFPAPQPFTIHGQRWEVEGVVIHECGTLARG